MTLHSSERWKGLPNMVRRDNIAPPFTIRLGVEAEGDKQHRVGLGTESCTKSYCNRNCSKLCTWWHCSRTVLKGRCLTAGLSCSLIRHCNRYYNNTSNSTAVWNKWNSKAILEMSTVRKYYITKKEKIALHKTKSLEKAWEVQTPDIWKAARKQLLCVVPHTHISKRNLLPTAVRTSSAEFVA